MCLDLHFEGNENVDCGFTGEIYRRVSLSGGKKYVHRQSFFKDLSDPEHCFEGDLRSHINIFAIYLLHWKAFRTFYFLPILPGWDRVCVQVPVAFTWWEGSVRKIIHTNELVITPSHAQCAIPILKTLIFRFISKLAATLGR